MCDDKLLISLKSRQVKLKPLNCTQNSTCWCNNLSFRFPMTQIQDECMSPEQMLAEYEHEMNKKDKQYLISLLGREFQVL